MIMREATRYSVMDDYTRTVYEPRAGAFLNGDTQVRAQLDYRRPIQVQEADILDDEEDDLVLAVGHIV